MISARCGGFCNLSNKLRDGLTKTTVFRTVVDKPFGKFHLSLIRLIKEEQMDLATAQPQQRQPDQREARQLLHSFCENGFDGSISACALALGRPPEEIGDMLFESKNIDEDL